MFPDPVEATFSPPLNPICEPVNEKFQVCWFTPLFMVLAPVAAVIADSAGAPPAPPHGAPESVTTVDADHFTQLFGVIAPVTDTMLAPASVAAPVPPRSIGRVPETVVSLSGNAP